MSHCWAFSASCTTSMTICMCCFADKSWCNTWFCQITEIVHTQLCQVCVHLFLFQADQPNMPNVGQTLSQFWMMMRGAADEAMHWPWLSECLLWWQECHTMKKQTNKCNVAESNLLAHFHTSTNSGPTWGSHTKWNDKRTANVCGEIVWTRR